MIKLFKVILFQFLLSMLFFNAVNSQETAINTSVQYDEIYDPFEPVNRAILGFNFFIDDVAIRPVIKTYKYIAPEPIEIGVSNFFSNLKEPIRGISFILQGEFIKSFNSVGRFTINSLTSLGTFDLASRIGMTKNETDLGLTFAKGGFSSVTPRLVAVWLSLASPGPSRWSAILPNHCLSYPSFLRCSWIPRTSSSGSACSGACSSAAQTVPSS